MSFDPKKSPFDLKKAVPYGSAMDAVQGKDLISEKSGSHLPNLDYRRLQMQAMGKLADSVKQGLRKSGTQAPAAGKYQNLITYLKQRSGTDVDPAELDRRMRTFFEDVITRVTKSPTDWDEDVTLDGEKMMDYLQGTNPESADKMHIPQEPGA